MEEQNQTIVVTGDVFAINLLIDIIEDMNASRNEDEQIEIKGE